MLIQYGWCSCETGKSCSMFFHYDVNLRRDIKMFDRSIVAQLCNTRLSLKEPGFESTFLLFWGLGIFVLSTMSQFTQLYNEYLAMDSGGDMWVNNPHAVIAAYLNASQRTLVGVGMNMSVREWSVKCFKWTIFSIFSYTHQIVALSAVVHIVWPCCSRPFLYKQIYCLHSDVPKRWKTDFAAEHSIAAKKLSNLKDRLLSSGLEVYDGYMLIPT